MKYQHTPPRGPLYMHVLSLATVLVIEPLVGARYLSTAQWLRDFYAWFPDRRRDWQRGQLGSVLRHAAAHVPFYRGMIGPDPDARSIPLHELPIVDKDQLRDDTQRFLSDGWERMPYLAKATGGTTGDPWCTCSTSMPGRTCMERRFTFVSASVAATASAWSFWARPRPSYQVGPRGRPNCEATSSAGSWPPPVWRSIPSRASSVPAKPGS